MSYGTFANGQICAQTYVTLLHVCFSCHGHLNSLHQPTSTAPGFFLHSFALLNTSSRAAPLHGKQQAYLTPSCTRARACNMRCTANYMLWCCTAGVPRADWSAPLHGKHQAHPTPSRTPARAPKKPHPMAVKAARRAQMTPAKASLPATAEHAVNTPAKRILSSSAVGSDSTPAKRLHSRGGLTPNRGPGLIGRSAMDGHQQHWHQQLDVRPGDDALGLDVSVGYLGRRLPLRSHPLGSSLPHASAFQHAPQLPFRAERMGSPAPFSNTGRAHDEGHVFDRVGTQPMTTAVRRAQHGLDGGAPCGRPQLRTPSRPNSTGSALRGYVPPDHRYMLNMIAHHCSALTEQSRHEALLIVAAQCYVNVSMCTAAAQSHALLVQLVVKCRSKKILGFQRKVGSKQARLHWQGSAPTYDDADPATDAAVLSDDDAAMAVADSVNWDLL